MAVNVKPSITAVTYNGTFFPSNLVFTHSTRIACIFWTRVEFTVPRVPNEQYTNI